MYYLLFYDKRYDIYIYILLSCNWCAAFFSCITLYYLIYVESYLMIVFLKVIQLRYIFEHYITRYVHENRIWVYTTEFYPWMLVKCSKIMKRRLHVHTKACKGQIQYSLLFFLKYWTLWSSINHIEHEHCKCRHSDFNRKGNIKTCWRSMNFTIKNMNCLF